ncbi:hypothetical protein DAEQUDRAFT_759899 [Daedalea quercina L-15889]|uniref:Uncharacterized protein n=1 Tax=Daedalea quercina L-15889 TaxID=1314783 RepID=A0A165LJI3_9APHY|nr:hypothetical protein DAEQUDRAFT_759899 [Daedalea quercina L-15889]
MSDATLDSGLSNAYSPTLFGDDQSEPPPSPTDSVYSDQYEVYVVQYHSADVLTPQWGLAVRTCTTTEFGETQGFGNLYRLGGCKGDYRYERTEGINYESFEGWRGSTLVGKIGSVELEDVEDIIQRMNISNEDPTFDCKTWVFGIIQTLHEHRFAVEEDITTSDELERRMNGLLDA